MARPSLSRGNEQYADDADLVRFLNPTHSEESVGEHDQVVHTQSLFCARSGGFKLYDYLLDRHG